MMSALMIAGMAVPAAASQQEKSVTVTTNIASSFTLSIPSATSINPGNIKTKMSGVLQVTGNVDADEQVTVSVTTTPLHNTSGGEIDYVITAGNDTEAFTGDTWNETELRANTPKEISLYVNIAKNDWLQARAGAYTGTVTFTAQLTNVSSEPET